MATDRIKYSEAIQTAAALTLNNNDVIALVQEDSQQETGYVSKATRMTTLGEKIVNGIDYTTELQTNSKKIIGAINELADGGGGGSADIISSASGTIATFNDGGDNIPLKSCEVAIVAQQASGTPSPSSPKTIVGYNSIALSNTPKNFFSGAVVSSDIDTDGQIIARTSAYWRSDKIPVGSVKKFTFSVFSNPNYATGSFNYRAFDSSGVMVTEANLFTNIGTTPSHTTVTLANNVAYVYIRGYQSGGASGITNSQIQFEFGETQTTYEPFGTTHTILLPETIYGGTAELVNGNGIKTFGYADLGDLSWGYAGGTFRAIVSDAITPISGGDTTAICEIYNRVSYSSSISDLSFYLCANQLSASKYLVIKDDSYNGDTTAFKAGVTGKKIVFTLATPTAFTFTGANIPTLSGENNVYADSGDVSIEYFNENADQMAELIRVMTR